MIKTSDLCRRYAKTYGVSIKYSESVVNSVFELLSEIIYEQGEDVQIRKFGAFKHKNFKPKTIRHPRTGELKTLPARSVVRFTQSESTKSLEEEV